MDLKEYIADVPDFPKSGILFRDISPLLRVPTILDSAVERLAAEAAKMQASHVVAIESRGFVFGVPVAMKLSLPVLLARKRGKLPGPCIQESYGLEYGEDVLELQQGALSPGSRALIVDDVLATGGTAAAAGRLVQQAGSELAGYLFLIELSFLDGRSKLGDIQTSALVSY